MFDDLPDLGSLAAADDATVVAAIEGWARAEAASAARRLAAIAELLHRRCGLDDSEDADEVDPRAFWACDGWDSAAAEVAAALGVSHRRASNQMHQARALRTRLPKTAELLARGLISAPIAATISWRTHLVDDDHALAAIDAAIAQRAGGWGALSAKLLDLSIDAVLEEHDPDALRRFHASARSRDVQFGKPDDDTGTASMWGRIYATDAALFERRVTVLIATLCPEDPRTTGERRSDAMGAIAAGAEGLACRCGRSGCPNRTGDARPGAVMIHVLADEAAIAAARAALTTAGIHTTEASAEPDAGPGQEADAEPVATEQFAVQRVAAEPVTAQPTATAEQPVPAPQQSACAADPDTGTRTDTDADTAEPTGGTQPAAPEPPETAEPAADQPRPVPRRGAALLRGGGVIPTPLLAELLRAGATISHLRPPCPIAEPRYRPSAKLAAFIRSRDLTCRFPGCSAPAECCDLDHTIAHPDGHTHQANLKCLCRRHHLLKTFWDGWTDLQHPDGTVTWTSPSGRAYTTHPGSRILFPQWNIHAQPPPSAAPQAAPPTTGNRGLMMPRRRRTRAADQRQRRKAERAQQQPTRHPTETSIGARPVAAEDGRIRPGW